MPAPHVSLDRTSAAPAFQAGALWSISSLRAGVLCGLLLLGPLACVVIAAEDGGMHEFFSSGGFTRSHAPPPRVEPYARWDAAPIAPRIAFRRARDAASAITLAAHIGKRRRHAGVLAYAPFDDGVRGRGRSTGASTSTADEARGLPRRAVCVRLCDGFFFPVGDLRSGEDAPAQEELCAGLCPSAPTRLYVIPSGSEKIEDAVSLRDGRNYTALPVAFRSASATDRTCTCHREGEAQQVSVLKDFTLRAGDSVMTESGVKVFRGSQRWPYTPRDFTALTQTHRLSGAARGALTTLERGGLRAKNRRNVSIPAAPRAAVADPATREGAKDREGRAIRIVGPQAMLLK